MDLTHNFFSALMIQGCTITHYELRKEIAPKVSSDKGGGCDFNYSFAMDDYRRFRTIGNQPNPGAAEDLDKYIKATQAVFTQKGCKANKTEDKDKAGFRIDILRAPQLSALPQEWLTGLTCGAIPGWGTRYGEYEYTFENVSLKNNHKYFIDRPAFNHIIVFPVFWLSFLWPDEIELYKKALSNFLENPPKQAAGAVETAQRPRRWARTASLLEPSIIKARVEDDTQCNKCDGGIIYGRSACVYGLWGRRVSGKPSFNRNGE